MEQTGHRFPLRNVDWLLLIKSDVYVKFPRLSHPHRRVLRAFFGESFVPRRFPRTNLLLRVRHGVQNPGVFVEVLFGDLVSRVQHTLVHRRLEVGRFGGFGGLDGAHGAYWVHRADGA